MQNSRLPEEFELSVFRDTFRHALCTRFSWFRDVWTVCCHCFESQRTSRASRNVGSSFMNEEISPISRVNATSGDARSFISSAPSCAGPVSFPEHRIYCTPTTSAAFSFTLPATLTTNFLSLEKPLSNAIESSSPFSLFRYIDRDLGSLFSFFVLNSSNSKLFSTARNYFNFRQFLQINRE